MARSKKELEQRLEEILVRIHFVNGEVADLISERDALYIERLAIMDEIGAILKARLSDAQR